ncbi:MAG: ATP-binding protein [Chthoniobacterales bacterium]
MQRLANTGIISFPGTATNEPQHVSLGELRANRLLSRVPGSVLAEIASRIPRVTVPAENIIFQEDDHGDCAYLILQGTVRISKRGRGGQQETLTYLQPGDYFGEMALLDSKVRSAQACAADGAVVGLVDHSTWDLLLQLAPQQVMSNFAWSLNERLRNNNQKYIEEMVRTERLSLLGQTLGSVVHDLRSPITCILGAMEMLQMRNTDPEAGCFFEMIGQAVERMQAMTEEIMDFSRGVTRLNVTRLPLSRLVTEIAKEEAHLFSSPNVKLVTELEQDGSIEIDRARIQRVIVNLLKNAREAIKASGTVTITATRNDGYAVISVRDTGCGIEQQRLASIFEPFVTHGKANGTGLGLAIAKSVVEAHNGRMIVTSEVGVGSVFEVQLPLCLGSK